MLSLKTNLSLRTGLFLLSLAYFSFTFYQMTVALLHNGHPGTTSYWVWATDTTGILGMGFRSAAGAIALISSLFFLLKKDLSKVETLMSLRLIVILEALYWFVSLFPSGLWGLTRLSSVTFLVTTTIPCLFESIILPIVFSMLFLKLNEKNLNNGAMKWGLIAGTAYIYVFWLNNLCNWAAAVYIKGASYLTSFPANVLSFALTSVGLLALALFSTYFTMKTLRGAGPVKMDLRKVGNLIVFFGLYFDAIFMLWIYLGSVGGWSTWYAWFLGHNADLWLMLAPLAGIPFFLSFEKTKFVGALARSAQAASLAFYAVFLAAYAFALPTNNVRIDQDAYRIPIAVFGGILLILILACTIMANFRKQKAN
jgi:hypothetical protein